MAHCADVYVSLCGMDEILNHAMSINLRTSLVPAPAVIPAQVAYTDVVAVKRLVVDCPGRGNGATGKTKQSPTLMTARTF